MERTKYMICLFFKRCRWRLVYNAVIVAAGIACYLWNGQKFGFSVVLFLYLPIMVRGSICWAKWKDAEEKMYRYGRHLPKHLQEELKKTMDEHVIENAFAVVTAITGILCWALL